MSAADVADLLRKKLDAQNGLLLESTMFPELASVLSAVGVEKLQLASAHIGDPPVVVVEGQGTLLGAKQATALHLEVSGADAMTATLTFTAPKGWGFKDGFPRLPGSYKHTNNNPGLVSLDTSILFDLPVASATITATSGSPTLQFSGSLADAKRFTFLAAALGMPAQPPLSGTLSLDSGAPTADLVVGDGSAALKIGALGFDKAGFRAYTVAHDDATGTAMTRLDFQGTLEVGETDPVPIRLSAPFYEQAGVLALTADFSGAELTIGRGVAAFAELLGLDVGEFALPKPLDILTSFGLKAISCTVSVDPAALQQLAITVGPDKPWTITDGVEVRDLTVAWAVAFPFVPEARAMSGSIGGTLALGTVDPKLEFDVYAASNGGFTASGALAHPMTLEQIVTTVSGSPVKGLPQLDVVTASIEAASSGDFDLAVALANWKIATVGTTDIVLYEVSAAVGRTGADPHGRFLAVLGVGTARLFVSAEMGMAGDAAAGGWVFQGGTVGDSSIAIGDLLTELADTFGIHEVPAPIASLSLTALNVTYKSATSEFSFTCTAKFTVDSTPVAVTASVKVKPTSPGDAADKATSTGTKGYSAAFTGQVKFAGLRFDIVFDAADNDTNVLVADYVPDKSDGKYTDVHSLVAAVSSSLSEAIPEGISVDLKEVKFVFLKQTESQWAFGLRLGSKIDLSKLPIVGSKLPAAETLAIDNLQILYSSKQLTKAQTDIINPVLPAGVAKLPETLGAGIGFDADVKLGAAQKHLHAGVTPPPAALPKTTGSAAGSTTPVAPKAAAPPSSTDPVTWLDVNKQFGIFSFQRIGVAYQKNVLEFALDASVALGPIAFSMQALTVGSPLQTFDPQFSLKGLALSFDRPPITIGGAFLKVDERLNGRPVSSYYGSLMVGVSQFSLKALGGWSPDADPASFFIYVNVDVPLGGPPFLFVTGLAGGFGINSSLKLPTIDKVGTYPLLPAKAPKEKGSAAETIATVIPALQDTFHPQPNEYWIAAGIQFTSFEMIKSQAVVSVSFGVDLQIGVVGTCSMSFPSRDDDPIAYVEIDVVASFTPSSGLLAVEGKLSPASYLLGGFVKLSGGFAFYAWFSGEHQGDFVVSLGGYHPAFKKPDNYPVVPRLQIEFSLGPLKVVGQSYFALTPGAFMAGIRISATFEAGPIKAWFSAGFDMLIAWAPFHYEARAWVTIGCSVDLGLFTISVQIGAEVEIWGPAFGGVAVIDLDVVSFTIGFGAEKAPPLPVGWNTFSESFLPAPEQAAPAPPPVAMAVTRGVAPVHTPTAPPPKTNVIKATVTSGQLDKGPKGTDWILDPDGFRILTFSTIPANHAEWATAANEKKPPELLNDVTKYARAPAEPAPADGAAPAGMRLQLDHDAVTASKAEVWEKALNVAPMNKHGVSSYHTIALRRFGGGSYSEYITDVTVTPQLAASNTALWGDKSDGDDPNAKRLIKATLTGLAISPVPRHPDAVSNVPLLSLLFGEDNESAFGYQRPEHDTTYTVGSEIGDEGKSLKIDVTGAHTATLSNSAFKLSALTEDWVGTQRDAIVAELGQLGFATTGAAKVNELADTALTDWPRAGRIGERT